jgi:hypothetical protein
MTKDAKLHARRIDNGQSEIWLQAEGRELTPRRGLATNEVISVTRQLCAHEIFKEFDAEYHTAVGHVATLAALNLDEIAAALRLKA